MICVCLCLCPYVWGRGAAHGACWKDAVHTFCKLYFLCQHGALILRDLRNKPPETTTYRIRILCNLRNTPTGTKHSFPKNMVGVLRSWLQLGFLHTIVFSCTCYSHAGSTCGLFKSKEEYTTKYVQHIYQPNRKNNLRADFKISFGSYTADCAEHACCAHAGRHDMWFFVISPYMPSYTYSFCSSCNPMPEVMQMPLHMGMLHTCF